MTERFLPLLEVTRGRIVESTHFGAVAIVNSRGKLYYSYGDPQTVAFLRSSAKPFQALPFVERGGVEHFGFTPRELALSCASHETAQIHLDAVQALQEKIGIHESDLQCGPHLPGDPEMLRKSSSTISRRRPTSTTAPANILPCWLTLKCADCHSKHISNTIIRSSRIF